MIVGLGNIGRQYDGTRHNIGFAAVDDFVASQEFVDWSVKKDLKCLITNKTDGDTRVIVIKPTTFMNLSGESVQAVSQFYKIPPSQILVVHDDLDIPFGQIRTRVGGSDAGNNGIKSVIQHIGANFGRVRIGIKPGEPSPMDAADFVLAKFSKTEQESLKNLSREVTSILTEFTASGDMPHETRNFII